MALIKLRDEIYPKLTGKMDHDVNLVKNYIEELRQMGIYIPPAAADPERKIKTNIDPVELAKVKTRLEPNL